jgi:hypothetical protein
MNPYISGNKQMGGWCQQFVYLLENVKISNFFQKDSDKSAFCGCAFLCAALGLFNVQVITHTKNMSIFVCFVSTTIGMERKK